MDWIRTCLVASSAFAVGSVVSLQQSSTALDAAGLKKMIEGLGYEVKDLSSDPGKEKYEFQTKTANFNIPVAAEISPSKNYVWLTINLGTNSPNKRHEQLLKENANIQPSFFYITSKNNLMLAAPMDNREITASVLKRILDKLVNDVDKTSATWKD